MLIPFEQMPESARLWIYQADRTLTEDEISLIEQATRHFLSGWVAHGQNLKASYKIAYRQFLTLTVDEGFGQASGCSIDASTNLIRALGNKLGISFMNNNKVAFLVNGEVRLLPFDTLKEKVAEQSILPSTPVFNNTVRNVGEYRTNWLTDSGKTWINRYFI